MFKILSIKSKEIKKGFIILSIFTLLSQFLALIRENIFSKFVGAGVDLDLYTASFRITDIVFIASASLISTFVLIPILNEKIGIKEGEENKEFKEYIDKVFTTFSLYLVILISVFYVFTPEIVSWIFDTYTGEKLEKFIEIVRISLLAPFFMAIANIFISINQVNYYFLPYALMSVLNNLSIIFATAFLYPKYGLNGMIWGVVGGAFLYLIIHFPTIIKDKNFPKFSSFLSKKEIIKIFSISIPRTIGIFSFALILTYIMSKLSTIGDGYITFFNWAFVLSSVPSGFLGMAYSIAAFPKLSKLFIENKIEEFSREISDIFKNIIFFGLPISLFFIIFSKEFVALIYWNDNFTNEKLVLISTALAIFSFSILFQSFNFVLTRAFFAINNTYVPFIMNVLGLIFLVTAGSFVFENFFNIELVNNLLKDNYLSNFSADNKFLIMSALYSLIFFLLSIGLFLVFKVKIKNLCVLKNISIVKKIMVNIFTFSTLYFLYKEFSARYFVENGQWNSFFTLAIFTVVTLILFVIFSKILKENEYLNFEKKIFRKFKK